MAFGLRSKRLSIPKGEEPGFTAAVFSRSFRETRGFDHLTARSVHSPKERRISAAILGTEPRKLPSPRRPGFSPGPLRLHLRLQNRGVQNRPGSGLGVRSSPQRRSSEPEYVLAGAGKEPPTLLPPSQQELVQVSQSPATVSEKFALLHRGKFALGTREPDGSDTCRQLASILGASHQVLLGPTRERECAAPPQHHPQVRSSILPPAEDGSVDSPGRWKRR